MSGVSLWCRGFLLVGIFCLLGGTRLMAEPGSDRTVRDKDNGATIQITKGSVLTVRLGVQPGTGYGWYLSKKEPELLKQTGSPVFEKGDGPLGGAEEEVFKFKAVATGTTPLEFQYRRSFEKESDQLFRIKAEIVSSSTPEKEPKSVTKKPE
jgi:predicted secreted protein